VFGILHFGEHCQQSNININLQLYYSADILFKNWLCLTEFNWCGGLDTVESVEMRRHLKERDQVLLLWDRSLSSVGTFECQAEGARVFT
jgi:hypothetical protein